MITDHPYQPDPELAPEDDDGKFCWEWHFGVDDMGRYCERPKSEHRESMTVYVLIYVEGDEYRYRGVFSSPGLAGLECQKLDHFRDPDTEGDNWTRDDPGEPDLRAWANGPWRIWEVLVDQTN